MDYITCHDLHELAQPRKSLGISLYMPYSDGSRGDSENPLILKSLLDEANSRLLKSGVKPAVIKKILQPGFALALDEAYWRNKFVTLAIFIFANEFRVYRLPFVCQQSNIISRYPYIKPILQDCLYNKKMYVLVLKAGGSKLFKFDKYHHSDITPTISKISSKEYADKYFQIEREQNYHFKRQGTGRTRQGLISHGHDNTEQLNKLRIKEYAYLIAKEVKNITDVENLPLILAGSKSGFLSQAFREAYDGSGLMPEYIQVETIPLNLGKIQKKISHIIDKIREIEGILSFERISSFLGTGYEESEPDQIVKRAFEGRIDALFVDSQKDVFGIINNFNDSYEVEITNNLDDENLTNIVAATTWDKNGKVFFLSSSIIDDRPMMALLRY